MRVGVHTDVCLSVCQCGQTCECARECVGARVACLLVVFLDHLLEARLELVQ